MTPELHRPWFSHYEPSVPRTVTVFDQPLYSLLDEAAARYPKRPALIFQNTRLSYKALHEAAERFAGALRRAGIRPGQRVAVMLPNLPQTMIAFWGVVKCGAVAVMVNPLYMERELLQNLNDAGAECLVLLDMLWPRVAPLRDRLPIKTYVVTGIADALSFPLNLIYRFTKGRQKAVPIPYDDKVIAWKDFSRGAQPLSEPIADPQNTPALLQYTGGTTGIPKGVALTHSNLGTNCRQILSIIQETPETEHRFVGLLPFFHVYGLTTGLTIPAALAATVLPLPRYVPQDVLHLIGKHRPTVFPGAPAVYSSLLQQKTLGQYDLTCIKLCISGSAPLPRDTFRRFQELTGAIILEGYGLTEASPITHINPREDSKQKEGSIGMPLPGTDARIVDSESGTAPPACGQAGGTGHPWPAGHAGLLAPARRDRQRPAQRLALYRRPGRHGRGRLFLHHGPQEGHGHRGRLQRLSA